MFIRNGATTIACVSLFHYRRSTTTTCVLCTFVSFGRFVFFLYLFIASFDFPMSRINCGAFGFGISFISFTLAQWQIVHPRGNAKKESIVCRHCRSFINPAYAIRFTKTAVSAAAVVVGRCRPRAITFIERELYRTPVQVFIASQPNSDSDSPRKSKANRYAKCQGNGKMGNYAFAKRLSVCLAVYTLHVNV